MRNPEAPIIWIPAPSTPLRTGFAGMTIINSVVTEHHLSLLLALAKNLTGRTQNQRGWHKRLTPERNRLLLISIQLIRTTAISLPTLFEGGRLLVLKLKGFAAAGPIKAVAK